jgi:hypothetical protein
MLQSSSVKLDSSEDFTTIGKTTQPYISTPPSPGQSTSTAGTALSTGRSGGKLCPPSYSDRIRPPRGGKDPDGSRKHWVRVTNAAISRAKAHVLPSRGMRSLPSVAENMRLRANKILDDLLKAAVHCGPDLQDVIQGYIANVASVCADLLKQCEKEPSPPLVPQFATQSSCDTTTSEPRAFDRATVTSVQGINTDGLQTSPEEIVLLCDTPFTNRLDVPEPAVRGPLTPATKAALPSDTQDSDSGSLTAEVHALTRVDNMWPDVPQFTTRVQHGSPSDRTSQPPTTSSGDASSLPIPAEGTSVAHIVAACNASAIYAVDMSVFTPTSAEKTSSSCDSSTMKKSDCTEELHHAPAAHTASMLIVTPTSAEKTILPCDSLCTKMGDNSNDEVHQPPLQLHDTTMLVPTSSRLLEEEGFANFLTHGFDPGGAAPYVMATPIEHRPRHFTTQTEIWFGQFPYSRVRRGWRGPLRDGRPHFTPSFRESGGDTQVPTPHFLCRPTPRAVEPPDVSPRPKDAVIAPTHGSSPQSTHETRFLSEPGSPYRQICRDLHHAYHIPLMSRLVLQSDEPDSDTAELSD